jgi:hypothetical protein
LDVVSVEIFTRGSRRPLNPSEIVKRRLSDKEHGAQFEASAPTPSTPAPLPSDHSFSNAMWPTSKDYDNPPLRHPPSNSKNYSAKPDYVLGRVGVNECPFGYSVIIASSHCKSAAASLGFETWLGGKDGECYIANDKARVHTAHGVAAEWVCEKETEFVLGRAGADECPPGYAVITDATLCKSASASLGFETWLGGTQGECYIASGKARLHTAHGGAAEWVCEKQAPAPTPPTPAPFQILFPPYHRYSNDLWPTSRKDRHCKEVCFLKEEEEWEVKCTWQDCDNCLWRDAPADSRTAHVQVFFYAEDYDDLCNPYWHYFLFYYEPDYYDYDNSPLPFR